MLIELDDHHLKKLVKRGMFQHDEDPKKQKQQKKNSSKD